MCSGNIWLVNTQQWLYHLTSLSWHPVPQFPAAKPRKHSDGLFLLCTNCRSLADFYQLLLLNFVLFTSPHSSLLCILLALFLVYWNNMIFIKQMLFAFSNLRGIFLNTKCLAFFLRLCCPIRGTHMPLLLFHLPYCCNKCKLYQLFVSWYCALFFPEVLSIFHSSLFPLAEDSHACIFFVSLYSTGLLLIVEK